MRKIGLLIIAPMFVLLWWPNVFAVEMEFNIGLAFDSPIEEPLPELSAGYGYNFGTCLWFKDKYGLALGALSTRHELDGGSDLSGQSFQVDSERDIIYLEGRYKFYQTERWEFMAHLGYNPHHKINGGDSTGSYVDFRDSVNYNVEDIGYSGTGYWLGLSVYRGIKSFNRGYFIFVSFKYNFINYTKQNYLDKVIDAGDTQREFMIRNEAETDYDASSFIIKLGIVLRFDFADF
jgi:hypothetical protein